MPFGTYENCQTNIYKNILFEMLVQNKKINNVGKATTSDTKMSKMRKNIEKKML